MTEALWMAMTDPESMLESLGKRTSARKLRLFACGCYHLLPSEYQSRELAEVCALVEGHVDEAADVDEMNRLRQAHVEPLFMTEGIRAQSQVRRLLLSARRRLRSSAQEFAALVVRLRWTAIFDEFRPHLADSIARQKAYDRGDVAQLVADLHGNPFRHITLSPSFHTPTVLALATQMYSSRDFTPMPILADALEDAGCTDAEVLGHCRGAGPHVRGCWAVDLVLGKS